MIKDGIIPDQQKEYRLLGMAINFCGHLRQRSPDRRNEQADC